MIEDSMSDHVNYHKYNYPIFYALIPIYENVRISFIGEYENNRNCILYHMICKCYLISENTSYLKDGTTKNTYKVLIPFEQTHFNNNIWHRIYYPESNSNLIATDYISTSYDDLDKIRQNLIENDESYFYSKALFINKLGDRYYELVEHYKEVEKLFNENLEDLVVSAINESGKYINHGYYDKEQYSVYINNEHERKRIHKGKDINDLDIHI